MGHEGASINTKDGLYGLALRSPDRDWMWDIAPLGEISCREFVRNHVLATTTPPHIQDETPHHLDS